jgi:chitosanase
MVKISVIAVDKNKAPQYKANLLIENDTSSVFVITSITAKLSTNSILKKVSKFDIKQSDGIITLSGNLSIKAGKSKSLKISGEGDIPSDFVVKTGGTPAPVPVPIPSPPEPVPPTPSGTTSGIIVTDPKDALDEEGNPKRGYASTSLRPSDVILQLVSIAENSSTDWKSQINYIEDIKDGRNFTISIVGFCVGTSDFLEVVQEIQKLDPSHVLVKYLPVLKTLVGSTSHKGIETLPADMKAMGIHDPVFNTAMWTVIDRLYWGPSLDYCTRHGLTSELAKYIVYDTCLNFGDFAYNSKYNMEKIPAISLGSDETAFLTSFLSMKEATIKADKSLGDVNKPPKILNRVGVQLKLLGEKNFGLEVPISVSTYGDNYVIS